jgi:hypothetical protein
MAIYYRGSDQAINSDRNVMSFALSTAAFAALGFVVDEGAALLPCKRSIRASSWP